MILWLKLLQDLYPYNHERAIGLQGDNILTVWMAAKGCDLQIATDQVGQRFAELMEAFQANIPRLPS